MDDLGLIETSWIDDPSCFGFWVNNPTWVGDPDFEGEFFLEDGSSRVNLKSLLVLLPPHKEVLDALGGMAISL